MATRALHTTSVVAGLAWVVVAAYGGLVAVGNGDGEWAPGYAVFAAALLVGAVAAVRVATLTTRESARPWLRVAGLAVSGFGCLAAVMAWNLPLWMVALGVGLALLAASAAPGRRRLIVGLAAGQLVGLAVLYAGIVAELGRRDEWGGYPVAGGIGLVTVAALTVLALATLVAHDRRNAGVEVAPIPSAAGRP